MGQRVKGQDVSLQVLVAGVPTIVAGSPIRNFDVTFKFQKLEEQYLGDMSKRYDEIFGGCDFKFDMNFEDQSVFQVVDAIRQRSIGQSRATNVTINIAVTLNFPNGQRPRITLNDCFFDDLPMTFGGREQYGQFTISGSCSDFDRVG